MGAWSWAHPCAVSHWRNVACAVGWPREWVTLSHSGTRVEWLPHDGPANDVAAQLDDLNAICTALTPTASELRLAAELAEKHALTFYDAAYAAAARSRGADLATGDRALLDAGVGASPSAIAAGLGL